MRKSLFVFVCSIFLCLFVTLGAERHVFAVAREITGKVVAIADGDTLTILTEEKKQIRLRLSDIDAPERRQPYGTRAREMLADLCFGKTVRANYSSADRYGRPIARIHAGETDINAEMVRRGGAWVYRKFSRDRSLLAIEDEAKAGKRGLWSLPERERIPPWEWRSERTRATAR